MTENSTKTELATFAAGCFWGVEATFRQLPGVVATSVGYIGGHTDHPTYEQVCGHATGHAEAVQVEFDPEQVTYETLLDVFWQSHDPTQLNRQGWDVGDNYRTEIFFHSPEQETAAIESKAKAQAGFRKPIVTAITAAPTFWPAEDYHQRYLEKRGQASCAVTVTN
jgi:peptide-methionine (S)-S-oxide reductase